jgi:hypothetical protein
MSLGREISRARPDEAAYYGRVGETPKTGKLRPTLRGWSTRVWLNGASQDVADVETADDQGEVVSILLAPHDTNQFGWLPNGPDGEIVAELDWWSWGQHFQAEVDYTYGSVITLIASKVHVKARYWQVGFYYYRPPNPFWDDYGSPPYTSPLIDMTTGLVIAAPPPFVPPSIFVPPAYVAPLVAPVPAPPATPPVPTAIVEDFVVSAAMTGGYLPRTQPATRTIGSDIVLTPGNGNQYRIPAFAKSVRVYGTPANVPLSFYWNTLDAFSPGNVEVLVTGYPSVALPVPSNVRRFTIGNNSLANINSYRCVFDLAL